MRDRIAARRAARQGGGAEQAAPEQAPEQAAPEQAAPEQAPTEAAGPSTDDQLNELKELSELHDQGILTDEEFEAKKKEILDAL